jgi:hypothetical protein
VDGETVLLCWKLGEKRITHWHSTDEGFAGRKPIDKRMTGSKEGRSEDRPGKERSGTDTPDKIN